MFQASFGPSPYFLHGHIEARVLKMSGNILLHLTNKWMPTAILHVLPCHPYKEEPVVPDHEATKPGKQGSLTGRDEKDAFSAVRKGILFLPKQCQNMHLKHNFPCTSTRAHSQNLVLWVSVLVHQEKWIMVLPFFFFSIELLENGRFVPGRASVLRDKAGTPQASWNSFRSLWTAWYYFESVTQN